MKIIELPGLTGLLFSLAKSKKAVLTFKLMCLQERPTVMLPHVILGMIGLVISAVAVVVFSIIIIAEDIVLGPIILLGGGLLVGKIYQYTK
jgi:hypothetical protein